MKKGSRTIGALVLVTVLTVGSVLPVYANEEEPVAYVPGEIVVLYRDDVSDTLAAEIVEAQGDESVEIISETEEGSIAVVSVAEDSSVEEAVQDYQADERVIAASPNFELELMSNGSVDDNFYSMQQYLTKTNVPQAWNIMNGTDHTKVTVAVLDTGTDISHPDLNNILNVDRSREVLGINGEMGPLKGDGYRGGIPSSGGGHGTHVSGIIAAQANNGVGIAGTGSALDNSVIDLVSVDVFSSDNTTNLSYVISGLEYARGIGAKVINLSLGVKQSAIGEFDTIFSAECKKLANDGIIMVCAAGKYGSGDNGVLDVVPSDYDSTISVISLDHNLNKTNDSCYGSLKDISAPGTEIYSTMKGGGYGTMSGTSMATPQVTGIVAMMCSVNPNLGPEDVRTILRETATDVGSAGYDIYTGAGVVNAQKAVTAAASYNGFFKSTGAPYDDTKKEDWFYSAVAYMHQVGIMTGLNPLVFGPSDEVFRAQFATMLHRMSGAGSVAYTSRFPDVGPGEFYTDSVLWAAGKNIIGGYENGYFGPADQITREQLAVLLYRYAKDLGYDVTNFNNLNRFPDADQVSGFAKEALTWANAVEIITGKGDGTLAPGAHANRAECATMMMRFMQKY